MPFNLIKYKNSKVFVKELKEVSLLMKEAIKKLEKYKKYSPVNKVLIELDDAVVIVDIHYNNQKKILDTKGLD